MVQQRVLQRLVHDGLVAAVAVRVGHGRLVSAVLHRSLVRLQRARLLLYLARRVDVDPRGDPPRAEEQRRKHRREGEKYDAGSAADGLRRNLDHRHRGAHALEHEQGEEEEDDRDGERDVRAVLQHLLVILRRVGVSLQVFAHVVADVGGDLILADDASLHVQVERAQDRHGVDHEDDEVREQPGEVAQDSHPDEGENHGGDEAHDEEDHPRLRKVVDVSLKRGHRGREEVADRGRERRDHGSDCEQLVIAG